MQPLKHLLDRIRWDPEFGQGELWLGYWDRVRAEIVRLRDAVFGEGGRFAFSVVNPEGSVHRIPLHRVRRVWRDSELLWRRDPSEPVGWFAGEPGRRAPT